MEQVIGFCLLLYAQLLGLITCFSTENTQCLIRGVVLLRFGKGTDTAVDASGLPGEN